MKRELGPAIFDLGAITKEEGRSVTGPSPAKTRYSDRRTARDLDRFQVIIRNLSAIVVYCLVIVYLWSSQLFYYVPTVYLQHIPDIHYLSIDSFYLNKIKYWQHSSHKFYL